MWQKHTKALSIVWQYSGWGKLSCVSYVDSNMSCGRRAHECKSLGLGELWSLLLSLDGKDALEAQYLDQLQDLFSRAQGKSLQGEENCGTPMALKYQEMKLMENAEQGEINTASDSSKAPREIHPLPGGLHRNGGILKQERKDLFKVRILDFTCDWLKERPLARDLRFAKIASCFQGPWVFDALH